MWKGIGTEGFKEGVSVWLFPICLGVIPLSIPAILLYRLYFFLRYGYNPTIEIDTFFPQSGAEFSWVGLEIVYDFVAALPLDGLLALSWIPLIYLTLFIVGEE